MSQNKYIVTADSNFRVMTDLVEGLRKCKKRLKIHCLIPKNISDRRHLSEAKIDKYIFYDAATNVFDTRFHFDANFIRNVLQREKYNMIFNNEPCLTLNFKVAALNCKKEPKIVTYNHWIDYSGSSKLPKYSYNTRQICGAIYSDLCLSNTNFSLDMWLDKAVDDFYDKKIKKDLKKKAFKCPPPFNVDEFKRVNIKKDKTFTIAYNQRLSTLPYYEYSWKNSFKIISELVNEDLNIKVLAFNPSKKYDMSNIKKKYDFIEFITPNNRLDYLNNLARCHLTFDFYKAERIWSIAILECCALNVVPLLQYYDGYKEMFEKNSFVYFPYQNKEVLKNKIKLVYNWTQHENDKVSDILSNCKRFMLENYSSEVIARNFLEKLKHMNMKRVNQLGLS